MGFPRNVLRVDKAFEVFNGCLFQYFVASSVSRRVMQSVLFRLDWSLAAL